MCRILASEGRRIVIWFHSRGALVSRMESRISMPWLFRATWSMRLLMAGLSQHLHGMPCWISRIRMIAHGPMVRCCPRPVSTTRSIVQKARSRMYWPGSRPTITAEATATPGITLIWVGWFSPKRSKGIRCFQIRMTSRRLKTGLVS